MKELNDNQRTIILLVGGVLSLAGTVIGLLFTPNPHNEIKKLSDRIDLLEKGGK